MMPLSMGVGAGMARSDPQPGVGPGESVPDRRVAPHVENSRARRPGGHSPGLPRDGCVVRCYCATKVSRSSPFTMSEYSTPGSKSEPRFTLFSAMP